MEAGLTSVEESSETGARVRLLLLFSSSSYSIAASSIGVSFAFSSFLLGVDSIDFDDLKD